MLFWTGYFKSLICYLISIFMSHVWIPIASLWDFQIIISHFIAPIILYYLPILSSNKLIIVDWWYLSARFLSRGIYPVIWRPLILLRSIVFNLFKNNNYEWISIYYFYSVYFIFILNLEVFSYNSIYIFFRL